MCGLIILALVIIVLVLVLKFMEVDFTLKFYEKFGKRAEDLCGNVVWITGASSGIGEYLAYELARVGCKLVLSARRQAELERVKAKCIEQTAALDANILVLPLDVTKYDTHQDALKSVLDHFGKVDILVNNSGRSQRGFVVDTDLKVDQSMFELNVIGTFSMTKVVLPHMIERKKGHIVVVSSLAGKFGFAFSSTYSATKFALHGFFDGLRGEVFDKGITVSAICPGPIKSAIVDNAYTEDVNKSFKDKSKIKEDLSRRMDTDKFVKRMTTAIANKLDEVWISPQPELIFIYAMQYMPTITRWISKRIVLKTIKKLRETEVKKDQ